MPVFSYICGMEDFMIGGLMRDSYDFNFSGIKPIIETDEGRCYLLSSVLQRDGAVLRFIRIFEGEGAVVFFYTFNDGKRFPWRVPVKFGSGFNTEDYQYRRDYVDMRLMVTAENGIVCIGLIPPEAINFGRQQ